MREHADAEEDRPTGLTPAVQAAAPWRVAHIEVLSGFRLHVRFNDGMEGNVELSEFLHSGSAGFSRRCGMQICSRRPGSNAAQSLGRVNSTLPRTPCIAPPRRTARGSWNKIGGQENTARMGCGRSCVTRLTVCAIRGTFPGFRKSSSGLRTHADA
jgi:hypothetical protein